jgi:hypothetical protein
MRREVLVEASVVLAQSVDLAGRGLIALISNPVDRELEETEEAL